MTLTCAHLQKKQYFVKKNMTIQDSPDACAAIVKQKTKTQKRKTAEQKDIHTLRWF